MLKAAVSRQREYLADARAVQWTRSRDGLGGVLRKVMAQRRDTPAGYAENPAHTGLAHPAVQHMLLVDVDGGSRMERWLDTHPTLDDRVQRVYGRRMQPLPAVPVTAGPESARRDTGVAPGAVSIASLVDPFARFM